MQLDGTYGRLREDGEVRIEPSWRVLHYWSILNTTVLPCRGNSLSAFVNANHIGYIAATDKTQRVQHVSWHLAPFVRRLFPNKRWHENKRGPIWKSFYRQAGSLRLPKLVTVLQWSVRLPHEQPRRYLQPQSALNYISIKRSMPTLPSLQNCLQCRRSRHTRNEST
jgi:hypothetical protein